MKNQDEIRIKLGRNLDEIRTKLGQNRDEIETKLGTKSGRNWDGKKMQNKKTLSIQKKTQNKKRRIKAPHPHPEQFKDYEAV